MDLQYLPGGNFIEQGLEDYRDGKVTVESCLVKIASPQLVRAGVLPSSHQAIDTELVLYRLLQKTESNPYSAYLSLIRNLCSFEQSLRFQNTEN